MNEIMWGDVIFQLVFLIILVVIASLTVFAIRALSKRAKQMDRIGEKLDAVSKQNKKDN
ncbi:DUF4083 domain-containing protein [Virgibacillus salexigens]|uniref:DUF4083 domain-containing protein n=1 Tax=Virgibacillus salexigens TaxID=61016 RepID=UPI003081E8A8